MKRIISSAKELKLPFCVQKKVGNKSYKKLLITKISLTKCKSLTFIRNQMAH